MKWPSWLPRVLVESALIVFSVLVALAVDQWRETRASQTRTREAVAAITAELQANRASAERARTFHRRPGRVGHCSRGGHAPDAAVGCGLEAVAGV